MLKYAAVLIFLLNRCCCITKQECNLDGLTNQFTRDSTRCYKNILISPVLINLEAASKVCKKMIYRLQYQRNVLQCYFQAFASTSSHRQKIIAINLLTIILDKSSTLKFAFFRHFSAASTKRSLSD